MIGDVLTRLERIGQSFEAGVAKPIRETQAIGAGLRAALGAFVGHRGTAPGKRPWNTKEFLAGTIYPAGASRDLGLLHTPA